MKLLIIDVCYVFTKIWLEQTGRMCNFGNNGREKRILSGVLTLGIYIDMLCILQYAWVRHIVS